jgi:hypothetical protein
MEIIVPAAGLSTRFPDMPPKYLLKDDTGTRMIENAVRPYIGRGDMYVGVLQEHDEKYDSRRAIIEISTISQVIPIVFSDRTKGPAHTVYNILKEIDRWLDDGAFLIKDCDSFFDHIIIKGNYVCTTTVQEHETLRRLASKSFVQVNDQGLITDIIEKKVVSDTFCVGGYKFEKRSEYMEAYEAIEQYSSDEIFVSHVIQYMINQGKQFFTQSVFDYVDVGTIDEWNDYLRNKE